MRRRAKKRNPYSVSLFPFLAVLICTLGVLIIMLVMAVHSAEKDGLESLKAVQENELEAIEDLKSQMDTRALKVDLLSQSRPDVLKRLRDIRSHRGQIAADTQRLEEELNELKLHKAALISADMEGSDEVSEIQLAQLEDELASAKLYRDNVAAQAQQAAANLVYWIIPSGSSGANRRPIYVECKREAIVLQPFGIELTADDFVHPVMAGNPFDVALTAISQYWRELDLAGDNGSPYPLLVVRPGGEQSYLVARHAMKSWEDEFGYELIEAEKTIDFGKQDQQLKSKLVDAITDARKKQAEKTAQQMLNQAAYGNGTHFAQSGSNRRSMNGGQTGLVASPGKGGFVRQGPNNRQSYEEVKNRQADSRSEKSSSSAIDSGAQSLAQKRSKTGGTPSQTKSKSRTPASDGGSSSIGNEAPPAQALAKQRGANWALPDHAHGATAYSRPIRVFCSDREFVIRSTAGADVNVPLKKSDLENVDRLVEGIWQTIESWGSAGQNGYWKPRLRITILPGGKEPFDRLRMLLDQSGLEIEEFRGDSGTHR